MKKHLLGGLAAVLVIGISASAAHAQCAFEHPKKAGKFQSNLLQAFVSCGNVGGNSPNTTTEGGVPACKPPETFNQQAGSPPSGWMWDELKGSGQVQFKASKKFPANVLNPPANTADIAVQLKLTGVVDSLGPATGPGKLATVARATFNDRMNGDLTVVDFPANFDFTMTGGKAKLKTTADTLLNGPGLNQPGLPKCASVELVSATVTDSNNNTFANTGTYLPE